MSKFLGLGDLVVGEQFYHKGTMLYVSEWMDELFTFGMFFQRHYTAVFMSSSVWLRDVLRFAVSINGSEEVREMFMGMDNSVHVLPKGLQPYDYYC